MMRKDAGPSGKTPAATKRRPTGMRPMPFQDALRHGMLRLACVLLTGFEVHVMDADTHYAVHGADNFSVVAVRGGAAKCITCKSSCLCADVVQMWRRRLNDMEPNA